jgi:DNA-binding Lrp family transcriptional regulator
VTGILDALSEVAHNYRRDHRLNMWFVLATETPEGIDSAVRAIEEAAELPVYAFPKEREYYLGMWLELDEDGALRTRSLPALPPGPKLPLDDLDRRIIAATQGGLPLTPEPCESVAEAVGCEPGEVVVRLEAMLSSGVIRRIGVVPNHYRLGFRGNGMTVWDVPDRRRDLVGEQVGALDYVSHCYARPRRSPDWPYNLFAMVHGRNRAQVGERVEEMTALLDGEVRGHEVLFSTAVLKKTGMRLPW